MRFSEKRGKSRGLFFMGTNFWESTKRLFFVTTKFRELSSEKFSSIISGRITVDDW